MSSRRGSVALVGVLVVASLMTLAAVGFGQRSPEARRAPRARHAPSEDGGAEHRATNGDSRGAPAARHLALGHGWACVLRDGDLACWGDARPPCSVSALSGAVEIAGRASMLCARFPDGRVECGEVDGLFPSVHGMGDAVYRVDGLAGATQIAVWDGGVCALRADGRVRCWDASRDPREGVRTVADLDEARALANGSEEICALRGAGEVRCWGPDMVAHAVAPSVHDARAVAVYAYNLCVAERDRVRCFSPAPDSMRLGLGGPNVRRFGDRGSPLSGARAVAAEEVGACGIGARGALRCWGIDVLEASGEDGVADLGPGFTEVALDSYGGCALRRDGEVRCWGWDRRRHETPVATIPLERTLV